MKSPKPPAPPDPIKTSQAQAAANKETAIAQTQLGMVNETNPYGSVSYRQIGTYEDGTPRFERITSLSPQQQGLFDQELAFDRKFNDLALSQTDRLADVLNSPLDLNDANAVEGRLFDLGRRRLDPVMEQQQEALRTRLANQGITQGTEAFDREMTRFMEGRNDAYNQLALTGRQQALSELLAERNQPINEIGALMSGGQVVVPQFAPAPAAGIAAPDVQGAFNNQYAAQMNAYNQQMGARNGLMGGLFGLGGAALGGWGQSGFAKPWG